MGVNYHSKRALSVRLLLHNESFTVSHSTKRYDLTNVAERVSLLVNRYFE